MATIILVLSGVLFVSVFGIHSVILNGEELDKPSYTSEPLLSSIPWISGFIIPVFIWAKVTDYNWIALFFINLTAVYLLRPWLTKGFLIRFASGKGLGQDMATAFVAGVIGLVVGLLLKYK